MFAIKFQLITTAIQQLVGLVIVFSLKGVILFHCYPKIILGRVIVFIVFFAVQSWVVFGFRCLLDMKDNDKPIVYKIIICLCKNKWDHDIFFNLDSSLVDN